MIKALKKIKKLYKIILNRIFNIFFKILFLTKFSGNFNLFKLKISPYLNWLQIINIKRVHNIISKNEDTPLWKLFIPSLYIIYKAVIIIGIKKIIEIYNIILKKNFILSLNFAIITPNFILI